eukprot:gnl/Chilomastix_cuspidata/1371.p1 GENE.gnl/Chilomastix_cuspidata/1371~~gnl/Chilomastix_cuspidata/1371.p1  ORF type:complete len:2367 (-),score=783.12 gnl/Chilomastix_cuspidata/1371:1326-8426(-)
MPATTARSAATAARPANSARCANVRPASASTPAAKPVPNAPTMYGERPSANVTEPGRSKSGLRFAILRAFSSCSRKKRVVLSAGMECATFACEGCIVATLCPNAAAGNGNRSSMSLRAVRFISVRNGAHERRGAAHVASPAAATAAAAASLQPRRAASHQASRGKRRLFARSICLEFQTTPASPPSMKPSDAPRREQVDDMPTDMPLVEIKLLQQRVTDLESKVDVSKWFSGRTADQHEQTLDQRIAIVQDALKKDVEAVGENHARDFVTLQREVQSSRAAISALEEHQLNNDLASKNLADAVSSLQKKIQAAETHYAELVSDAKMASLKQIKTLEASVALSRQQTDSVLSNEKSERTALANALEARAAGLDKRVEQQASAQAELGQSLRASVESEAEARLRLEGAFAAFKEEAAQVRERDAQDLKESVSQEIASAQAGLQELIEAGASSTQKEVEVLVASLRPRQETLEEALAEHGRQLGTLSESIAGVLLTNREAAARALSEANEHTDQQAAAASASLHDTEARLKSSFGEQTSVLAERLAAFERQHGEREGRLSAAFSDANARNEKELSELSSALHGLSDRLDAKLDASLRRIEEDASKERRRVEEGFAQRVGEQGETISQLRQELQSLRQELAETRRAHELREAAVDARLDAAESAHAEFENETRRRNTERAQAVDERLGDAVRRVDLSAEDLLSKINQNTVAQRDEAQAIRAQLVRVLEDSDSSARSLTEALEAASSRMGEKYDSLSARVEADNARLLEGFEARTAAANEETKQAMAEEALHVKRLFEESKQEIRDEALRFGESVRFEVRESCATMNKTLRETRAQTLQSLDAHEDTLVTLQQRLAQNVEETSANRDGIASLKATQVTMSQRAQEGLDEVRRTVEAQLIRHTAQEIEKLDEAQDAKRRTAISDIRDESSKINLNVQAHAAELTRLQASVAEQTKELLHAKTTATADLAAARDELRGTIEAVEANTAEALLQNAAEMSEKQSALQAAIEEEARSASERREELQLALTAQGERLRSGFSEMRALVKRETDAQKQRTKKLLRRERTRNEQARGNISRELAAACSEFDEKLTNQGKESAAQGERLDMAIDSLRTQIALINDLSGTNSSRISEANATILKQGKELAAQLVSVRSDLQQELAEAASNWAARLSNADAKAESALEALRKDLATASENAEMDLASARAASAASVEELRALISALGEKAERSEAQLKQSLGATEASLATRIEAAAEAAKRVLSEANSLTLLEKNKLDSKLAELTSATESTIGALGASLREEQGAIRHELLSTFTSRLSEHDKKFEGQATELASLGVRIQEAHDSAKAAVAKESKETRGKVKQCAAKIDEVLGFVETSNDALSARVTALADASNAHEETHTAERAQAQARVADIERQVGKTADALRTQITESEAALEKKSSGALRSHEKEAAARHNAAEEAITLLGNRLAEAVQKTEARLATQAELHAAEVASARSMIGEAERKALGELEALDSRLQIQISKIESEELPALRESITAASDAAEERARPAFVLEQLEQLAEKMRTDLHRTAEGLGARVRDAKDAFDKTASQQRRELGSLAQTVSDTSAAAAARVSDIQQTLAQQILDLDDKLTAKIGEAMQSSSDGVKGLSQQVDASLADIRRAATDQSAETRELARATTADAAEAISRSGAALSERFSKELEAAQSRMLQASNEAARRALAHIEGLQTAQKTLRTSVDEVSRLAQASMETSNGAFKHAADASKAASQFREEARLRREEEIRTSESLHRSAQQTLHSELESFRQELTMLRDAAAARGRAEKDKRKAAIAKSEENSSEFARALNQNLCQQMDELRQALTARTHEQSVRIDKLAALEDATKLEVAAQLDELRGLISASTDEAGASRASFVEQVEQKLDAMLSALNSHRESTTTKVENALNAHTFLTKSLDERVSERVAAVEGAAAETQARLEAETKKVFARVSGESQRLAQTVDRDRENADRRIRALGKKAAGEIKVTRESLSEFSQNVADKLKSLSSVIYVEQQARQAFMDGARKELHETEAARQAREKDAAAAAAAHHAKVLELINAASESLSERVGELAKDYRKIHEFSAHRDAEIDAKVAAFEERRHELDKSLDAAIAQIKRRTQALEGEVSATQALVDSNKDVTRKELSKLRSAVAKAEGLALSASQNERESGDRMDARIIDLVRAVQRLEFRVRTSLAKIAAGAHSRLEVTEAEYPPELRGAVSIAAFDHGPPDAPDAGDRVPPVSQASILQRNIARPMSMSTLDVSQTTKDSWYTPEDPSDRVDVAVMEALKSVPVPHRINLPKVRTGVYMADRQLRVTVVDGVAFCRTMARDAKREPLRAYLERLYGVSLSRRARR